MKLLTDAKRILQENGIIRLSHGFLWLVWSRSFRRFMPLEDPSDPIIIDNVKSINRRSFYQRRVGDRIIGWKSPEYKFDSYNQAGEVNAHHMLTREAEHVCIIGGGYGITTVHAARQVGGEGW